MSLAGDMRRLSGVLQCRGFLVEAQRLRGLADGVERSGVADNEETRRMLAALDAATRKEDDK